jgi:hypothetical protein
MLPGDKARPERKSDNLTAICEPIVKTASRILCALHNQVFTYFNQEISYQ